MSPIEGTPEEKKSDIVGGRASWPSENVGMGPF